MLDNNSLRGTIPSGIDKLVSLSKINLNSNLLTGTIPSTFYALKILRTLDLNFNYLTMGSASTVPISTFSDVTYRGALDLSLNCLRFTNFDMTVVTPTRCKPAPTSKFTIK